MTGIITLRFALLLALIGMLAACGNANVPAAGIAPSAARPGSQPTPQPIATVALPAASGPAAATVAPTKIAPATAGAAIPQGLTPEGYHFRGRADAPVTIVMYSDFL
jgi:protein-disulfide isomerase